MSRIEYIIYFSSICIAIAIGGFGAYFFVNLQNGDTEYIQKEHIDFSKEEENFKKHGQVIGVDSNLAIRKDNNINSEAIYVLYEGMTFDILDKKDDWYYIKYEDNIEGYINGEYVEEYDDKPPNKAYEETEDSIISKIFKNIPIPLRVELTAYCNCEICSEIWGSETAMQTKTRKGVVAAPKEIPLGSRIYIPQLEYYKPDCIFDVEDRGGAVKVKDDGTYIIDVWLPDHEQVKKFGRKLCIVYFI